MEKVKVSGLDFPISKFSFGTATLIKLGSVRKQVDHVKYAADIGFSHFDTSPYYGFGMSEVILGEALGTKQQVTIATKIGIYPPKMFFQRPNYYEIVGRKILNRVLGNCATPIIDFDFEVASASLSLSLRRLKRNNIDILFVHEPNLIKINRDQLVQWMHSERHRVTKFGFAGKISSIKKFLPYFSPTDFVYQGPCDQLNDFTSLNYGHFRNPLLANNQKSYKPFQENRKSFIVYSSNRS